MRRPSRFLRKYQPGLAKIPTPAELCWLERIGAAGFVNRLEYPPTDGLHPMWCPGAPLPRQDWQVQRPADEAYMLGAHKQVREVVHRLFCACIAHQQRLADAGLCDGKVLASPLLLGHPWDEQPVPPQTRQPSCAQRGGSEPDAEKSPAYQQDLAWS